MIETEKLQNGVGRIKIGASVNEAAKIKQIRATIMKMAYVNKLCNVKSAMTVVDILVPLLYSDYLGFNITKDSLILSKGHGCMALYAVGADLGWINKKELLSIRKDEFSLPRYATLNTLPMIDFCSASLGHGLGVAAGISYLNKIMGKRNKTFCVLGDAECQEGSVYEAANFIRKHDLDVQVLVDYNRMSSLETDIRPPLLKCNYSTFCTEIGVDFMNNDVVWHYRVPTKSDYEKALACLGEEPIF